MCLSFGEKKILDAISLAVPAQERLVIIGQSGMGKTTILRLILGVIQPDRGQVLFEGRDIAGLTATELQQIRSRIGMVYQDARAPQFLQRAGKPGSAPAGVDSKDGR